MLPQVQSENLYIAFCVKSLRLQLNLKSTWNLQGPPAALIHETFAEFRDNCRHIPLDPWICQSVTDLNVMMSASYRTPIPESKMSKKQQLLLRDLEELFDPADSKASQLPSASTSEDYVQAASGGREAERMARVRRFLGDLLGHYAAPDVKPSLDTSPPTQVLLCCSMIAHNAP